MSFTLEELEKIIARRANISPEKSYSAKLLSSGAKKCAEKFGEEAIELIIAAISGDKDELGQEAADMLYHFLILLKAHNIEFAQILNILHKRTSLSGLEEKQARKQKN